MSGRFVSGANFKHVLHLHSKHNSPHDGCRNIMSDYVSKFKASHSILQDVGFSQLWLGRVLSSGIQRRVVCWKSTNVSGEKIASIFMLEE
jgi:hypothetical protein